MNLKINKNDNTLKHNKLNAKTTLTFSLYRIPPQRIFQKTVIYSQTLNHIIFTTIHGKPTEESKGFVGNNTISIIVDSF